MRVIVLFLALIFGSAWSSEPVTQQAQSWKKQTTKEQRGTEGSPFFVKGEVTTKKNEQETKDEAAASKEKSAVDAALVKYTGLTAAFTLFLFLAAAVQVGLFVWQLRLMRKAVDDAANVAEAAIVSAKAANSSANAAMLAERAYVKMSHHPPGVQIREHDFWVAISIENFGHTPARVIDVVVQSLCLLPGEAMPDVPQYNRPKDLVASHSFLVSGEKLSFAYVPDESIDIDALKNGTQTLYVFGYVDYIDVFKVKHRAGYGRRYGGEWDDPSRYGNDLEYAKRSNLLYMHEPQYNYDRKS